MQKVACVSCGVMILPATAEDNGGQCTPCCRGTRRAIEEAKKRWLDEQKYNPFDALWNSLLERDKNSGFESLTEIVKIYFSLRLLDAEIYRGGLDAYFFNSAGDYFHKVEDGLDLLNAHETKRIVQSAATTIFMSYPLPRSTEDRREYLLELMASGDDLKIQSTVDKLELEYCSDPDRLDDKIARFALEAGLLDPFKKDNG